MIARPNIKIMLMLLPLAGMASGESALASNGQSHDGLWTVYGRKGAHIALVKSEPGYGAWLQVACRDGRPTLEIGVQGLALSAVPSPLMSLAWGNRTTELQSAQVIAQDVISTPFPAGVESEWAGMEMLSIDVSQGPDGATARFPGDGATAAVVKALSDCGTR